MQETWVPSLVREDPTHCGATKPVNLSYWTRARELRLLKPESLEPMLHHKRRHRSEKPVRCNWRTAPSERLPDQDAAQSVLSFLHTVSGVWQTVRKGLKTQRDLNELLTTADLLLKLEINLRKHQGCLEAKDWFIVGRFAIWGYTSFACN